MDKNSVGVDDDDDHVAVVAGDAWGDAPALESTQLERIIREKIPM